MLRPTSSAAKAEASHLQATTSEDDGASFTRSAEISDSTTLRTDQLAVPFSEPLAHSPGPAAERNIVENAYKRFRPSQEDTPSCVSAAATLPGEHHSRHLTAEDDDFFLVSSPWSPLAQPAGLFLPPQSTALFRSFPDSDTGNEQFLPQLEPSELALCSQALDFGRVQPEGQQPPAGQCLPVEKFSSAIDPQQSQVWGHPPDESLAPQLPDIPASSLFPLDPQAGSTGLFRAEPCQSRQGLALREWPSSLQTETIYPDQAPALGLASWGTQHARFKELASIQLLRGMTSKASDIETEEAVLGTLRAEQEWLAASKQQTLKELQRLSKQYLVQEESEARVLELVDILLKLRSKQGSPVDDVRKISSIIDVVDDINLARGSENPDRKLRYFKAMGQRLVKVMQIPEVLEMTSGHTGKMDCSKTKSCFKEMIALMAGDEAAGEVAMEMSFSSYKGRVFMLKEIAAMDVRELSAIFRECMRASKEELCPLVKNAVSEEARTEALAALRSAAVEIFVLASTGFGVVNVIASSSCWSTDPVFNQARPEEGTESDAVALRQLDFSAKQLAVIWALQESRANINRAFDKKLEKLKAEVTAIVQTLPGHCSKTSSSYLDLLETVGTLQDILVNAKVLTRVSHFVCYCILDPVQGAQAAAAVFPSIPSLSSMYDARTLPQPDQAQRLAVQQFSQQVVSAIAGDPQAVADALS